PPMAREHAARVAVGDEDRPVEGIEQDGIGRLGADAAHREKLSSQGFQRRLAQPLQASAGPLQEKDGERAEPPRLEAPCARGANEPSQPRQRQSAEPPGRETASGPEIAYGPRDARPG